MSAPGGPRPSSMYIERQLLTRLPATPTTPTGLTSNTAAFNATINAPPQGTATPGDGLVLANVMAIVVSVFPWVGATFSGAGSALCWVWDAYSQRPCRFADLDLDFTSSSGFPGQVFVFQNVARLGSYINWYASGITTSAGTDVLFQLAGFQSTFAQAI